MTSPFNARTGAAIIAAKAKGLTHEAACKRAGIAERTLRKWRSWGKAGREPFATFEVAFVAAEERGKRARVAAEIEKLQSLGGTAA